jgi:molybdopterin-guanine dinucleotide biosynthesis protein A
MFDVVVLAGTSKASELTSCEQVDNKAFILIEGRPLLAFVLEALRAAPEVGRIAVVGPRERLTHLIGEYEALLVQETDTIPGNILAGYRALQPKKHFLLATADIPLLSAAALADFLERTKPCLYDFYYPIVARKDSERCFPGVVRTYVALREGTFTGGNIFLLNPDKVEEAMPRFHRFIAWRKSPLKLAGILGPLFILKFLTRRLSIGEVERCLANLFGISGKAIISGYAEISTDVDKLSDLELVRNFFRQ